MRIISHCYSHFTLLGRDTQGKKHRPAIRAKSAAGGEDCPTARSAVSRRGLTISRALAACVKNAFFADQTPCREASFKRSAFHSPARIHSRAKHAFSSRSCGALGSPLRLARLSLSGLTARSTASRRGLTISGALAACVKNAFFCRPSPLPGSVVQAKRVSLPGKDTFQGKKHAFSSRPCGALGSPLLRPG